MAITLVFDLIERTLWLCEVTDEEVESGDEPVGTHRCCCFENWSEAARALESATRQAQYQLLLRGDQKHAVAQTGGESNA